METKKRLFELIECLEHCADNTDCESCSRWLYPCDEHCVDDLLATAAKELKKLVDAVEVVRCKDCRWAREKDHREPTDTPKDSLICQCFMNHHIPAPWGARLAVKPEHFCSYGERRTDGR